MIESAICSISCPKHLIISARYKIGYTTETFHKVLLKRLCKEMGLFYTTLDKRRKVKSYFPRECF